MTASNAIVTAIVAVAVAGIAGAWGVPAQTVAILGFAGVICASLTTALLAARAAVEVVNVKTDLAKATETTGEKLDEIHQAVNGGLSEVKRELAAALRHTADRERTPASQEAARVAEKSSADHEAQTQKIKTGG